MRRLALIAIAAAALTGCTPEQADDGDSSTADTGDMQAAADKAPTDPPATIGAEIARTEWTKAENRADCAPLGLVNDGAAAGVPRRAEFTGGWAVAFDRPDLRSAYGFAGTDVDLDNVPDRAGLDGQWPLLIDLGPNDSQLPAGSYAGYGLDGAADWPFDNRSGEGMHNAAYLRVAGQACLYNVWSRIIAATSSA